MKKTLLVLLVLSLLAAPARASDSAWVLGNSTTVDLATDLTLLRESKERAEAFLKSFLSEALIVRDKGSIFVGGVPVDFEKYGAQPLYLKDRTMVPLRAIAEAYGASVDWNEQARVVTIRHWTNNIQLRVGDNRLYVDGNEIIMDVNSFIFKDRTYVPLRAIGDFMGAEVFWDPVTRNITLTNEWREKTVLAKTLDESKTVEIHIQPVETH